MKYRPGTPLHSIVLDDCACVSTPPQVTSALLYPNVPVGVICQFFNFSASMRNSFSAYWLIGMFSIHCVSTISANRFGKYWDKKLLNNVLLLRCCVNISRRSCSGSRSTESGLPCSQYEEICRMAGPLNPR